MPSDRVGLGVGGNAQREGVAEVTEGVVVLERLVADEELDDLRRAGVPPHPDGEAPTSAWRTPSDVSRADASRAAWRIFGATTPSTAVRSS